MDNRQDRIRERAYQLWEQEGRLDGRDIEHWLAAEQSVAAESEADGAVRGKQDAAAGKGSRPRGKADSSAGSEQ